MLKQTEQPSSASPSRYAHAWRALRHRNFRLYFTGQSISLIGTWMTRVATSWLVYRLTGSALLLGVVGFAGQIPTFLLAPFAGVLVDRLNRRNLLVWTQVLAGLQSLAIAVLTLAKVITIHEIIALSAFQGLINAFDMPGRQSFLVQMVSDDTGKPEKQDLSNAIALNSSIVNMARLVGPSLAGLVIAAVGEGYCFAIDGVSYIAVVVSLLMMRVPPSTVKRATTSMLEQLREGWSYVVNFRPIRTILTLFALLSLMGMPFIVLMPIFASQVLHGGPHTLGYLMGASGVGALVSALSLALRKSVRGLTTMIQIAAVMFGSGLILFGLSRHLALSLLLMLIVGFGMMQGLAASNTVIQTLAPEDKRGRVMSYYTMAFVGMTPFGSLLAGVLAHRFGAPHAVMITGAFCFAGAAWYTTQLRSIRAVMRPIYIEMGILKNPSEPVLEEQAGTN
ncbi:MFS transporter [Tunturiibacter lichenicola]|uniref:MFS transporter n=1 Tax=Tunturiibacter lichenicola TaxID=2051959 RepID=UPI0021B1EABD|nr:MFS transporter [Edaphobacter lichenicola]